MVMDYKLIKDAGFIMEDANVAELINAAETETKESQINPEIIKRLDNAGSSYLIIYEVINNLRNIWDELKLLYNRLLNSNDVSLEDYIEELRRFTNSTNEVYSRVINKLSSLTLSISDNVVCFPIISMNGFIQRHRDEIYSGNLAVTRVSVAKDFPLIDRWDIKDRLTAFNKSREGLFKKAITLEELFTDPLIDSIKEIYGDINTLIDRFINNTDSFIKYDYRTVELSHIRECLNYEIAEPDSRIGQFKSLLSQIVSKIRFILQTIYDIDTTRAENQNVDNIEYILRDIITTHHQLFYTVLLHSIIFSQSIDTQICMYNGIKDWANEIYSKYNK